MSGINNLSCVFRVDASEAIGTGHFMRCLTLAHALNAQGFKIHFICRDLGLPIHNLLTSTGFEVHWLKRPAHLIKKSDCYEDWLNVPVVQDIEETITVMKGLGECEWLIVDHYALDATWEKGVREHAKHVLIIDDLANRSHGCDLLLDQNFYLNAQDRYHNRVHASCRMLLGLDYVLLNNSFRSVLKQAFVRTNLKTILVHFGGIDANNETLKAVKGLLSLNLPAKIEVILGMWAPHKAEVEAFCQAHDKVQVHCQTPILEQIILQSDLAVGAGGVALWERMALGLPSIVSSLAENQRPILEDLASTDSIQYLGLASKTTSHSYAEAVEKLNGNLNSLSKISMRGLKLIDGNGPSRILENMKQLGDFPTHDPVKTRYVQ